MLYCDGHILVIKEVTKFQETSPAVRKVDLSNPDSLDELVPILADWKKAICHD